MTNVVSLLDAAEALHMLRHGPREWNVPGPGDLAMSGPLNTSVRVAPPIPQSTAIEALRHMRDTTQSQQQYDRAVEALRQMGVDHD